MPERIYSEGLMLPDGRKVRVLSPTTTAACAFDSTARRT